MLYVEDKTGRRNWQDGFRQMVRRVYQCPAGATLSDLSMEEGDNLPGDATYEISASNLDTDPRGNRIAVVTAFKTDKV